MTRLDLPAWAAPAAAGFGVAAVLATGGWAVADAVMHPEPASAGRLIEVRRQVVRAAPYVAPPITEEARLDVRPTGYLAAPDPSLAAVEADASWRAMQQEDTARMRAALAEVRAADARVDRELASALSQSRPAPEAASETATEAPASPAVEG